MINNDTTSASFESSLLVLDARCDLHGTLQFHGDVCLRGSFDGTLEIEGRLEVAAGARLRGNVTVRRLDANGVVEAAVNAAEGVWLGPAGELRGGVSTPLLQTRGASTPATSPAPAVGTAAAGAAAPSSPAAADPVEGPVGVLHRRRRHTPRPLAQAAGR